MIKTATVIEQTTRWIEKVVIGCNFCPFAPRVIEKKSIAYSVSSAGTTSEVKAAFLKECVLLDEQPERETTLLIFPDTFAIFSDYLNLVTHINKLVNKGKYRGVYQVATFHPAYSFAGVAEDDAANFTNRSIYPMLHILRENSVEQALKHYTGAEKIPDNNIAFAHEKGIEYMKLLRDSCL